MGVDQTHGGGKLLLGMCKSKISGEEEGVFPLWRFTPPSPHPIHPNSPQSINAEPFLRFIIFTNNSVDFSVIYA